MEASTHILVVMENQELAARLAQGLRRVGYEVSQEWTAQAALARATHNAPHLFLLSKALPEMSGHQLAVELRQLGQKQPLIMLDDGHGSTAPLVAASEMVGQLAIVNERTPLITLVACIRDQLLRFQGGPTA